MTATNPFPGMNPYLEQRWGDVHASLVTYARDQLQDALPEDLRARMQERVFVESAGDVERAISPDVHVYERNPRPPAVPASPAPGAALAEPLILHVSDVEVTESYIEIIDARSGGRVVTVIEFLSPSNKTHGPGRDLYVRKQSETRQAGVNLVEIDLLRGGHPVTLTPPDRVPPDRRAPYHASVFRGSRPARREYYAFPLRDRLPTIRVPLRPTDADAPLDLQALVDLCHRRGRYDDIDYGQPLKPPLSREDAEWAEGVLGKPSR